MVLSGIPKSPCTRVHHLCLDRITVGWNAIFGHVVRLPDNTLAHQSHALSWPLESPVVCVPSGPITVEFLELVSLW